VNELGRTALVLGRFDVDTLQRARETVVRHALGEQDCVELLDMLGLDPLKETS
jgi:hypothetical protein